MQVRRAFPMARLRPKHCPTCIKWGQPSGIIADGCDEVCEIHTWAQGRFTSRSPGNPPRKQREAKQKKRHRCFRALVGVQNQSCHLAQRQCLFALQAWPLRHHAPCAEDLRSENMTYHTWFHRSWGNQTAESFFHLVGTGDAFNSCIFVGIVDAIAAQWRSGRMPTRHTRHTFLFC